MSNQRLDDGGLVLGKCNNTSDSSITYVPAAHQTTDVPPPNCPVGRNGVPIYGLVNMSGNQDTGCRSIPLHGHPQDFSRKLYNDSFNALPFGWEERGVELYENFGLSEDVFVNSGNYGVLGSSADYENYTNPDNGTYIGYKCSRPNTTCSSRDSNGNTCCQNRCITELGRKLTLFGQVGFSFYDSGMPNGYTQVFNLVLPADLNTGVARYGYLFNFMKDIRTDTGDLYSYFGNSGAIFKDANGVQYVFVYGQTPYIITNGAKSFPSADRLANYVIVDDENKSMFVDVKYFNEDITGVYGIKCNSITPSASTTTNCTSSSQLDGLGVPATPVPFPGNWYSQLFCDTGRADPGVTNFANCSYSGFRSMYIPPHMRVDGFTTLEYSGNSAPWTSQSGTQTYYMVNRYQTPAAFSPTFLSQVYPMPNPFTYDMSPYSNGTFPSLTGDGPNSPLSSPMNYTAKSYLQPNIHNCALFAIWVNVRRDDVFYNRYVSRWYSNAKLLPEIMLIPGIQNSSVFMEDLASPTPKANPLQMIENPSEFWTTSNPYWDGSSSVVLDPTKSPYDVFPIPATNTAMVRAFKHTDKFLNILPGKVIKKLVNEKIYRPLKNTMTAVPTMVGGGTGRIVSFTPANGIMSLEWLYVIYTCAFSYAPGQTNGIIYDSENTNEYQCAGNSSTCARECMLFRDPYYTYSNVNTSSSDMFMKTYCFMKNLTLSYAKYSDPANNDCSCTSTMSYCPAAFSPACDPTNTQGQQIYIPDGTLDQESSCNDVCSYCKAVNVQLNIASGQMTGTENNNIKSVGACSQQTTCFTGSGDTVTSTDTPGPDYKVWIMFIILIFVIIIAISLAYPAYQLYKQNI